MDIIEFGYDDNQLQWQHQLKVEIRQRLARPVDTSGHLNLEMYIWACRNDCVRGWNFVSQQHEG